MPLRAQGRRCRCAGVRATFVSSVLSVFSGTSRAAGAGGGSVSRERHSARVSAVSAAASMLAREAAAFASCRSATNLATRSLSLVLALVRLPSLVFQASSAALCSRRASASLALNSTSALATASCISRWGGLVSARRLCSAKSSHSCWYRFSDAKRRACISSHEALSCLICTCCSPTRCAASSLALRTFASHSAKRVACSFSSSVCFFRSNRSHSSKCRRRSSVAATSRFSLSSAKDSARIFARCSCSMPVSRSLSRSISLSIALRLCSSRRFIMSPSWFFRHTSTCHAALYSGVARMSSST
eukprot:Sspe_Gene.98047::Locus_71508_Transcript_2_2_Confidence_0.667_Length_1247::g.98047::m.98047